MARYVEFALGDGSTIVVESDETGTGVVKAGRLQTEILERAQTTFEEAVDKARRAASVIAEKVRAHEMPDQLEITFGLKASGELGTLIVAKAGIEANYSVKLTWKKEG